MMMKGDGFHYHVRHPPEAHQISGYLCMGCPDEFFLDFPQQRIVVAGPGKHLLVGLGEILRQDQFAQIVKDAGHKCAICEFFRILLQGGYSFGAHAGLQTVVPEFVHRKKGHRALIELGKDLGRQDQ